MEMNYLNNLQKNIMNKVKVWGKEVTCCNMCNYNYYDGLIGGLRCNLSPKPIIGNRDKNSIEPIYKDCPFSKPVTKEVIEEFGFKYIKTHPGTTESYFEFPDSEWGLDFDPNWKGILYIRIYVFGCDGDTTYFAGTINNPIELEFILKSVGVIE